MDIIGQIIEWTKLKCRIQITPDTRPYFKEREIWWASIGANIGTELNGKNELFDRPALIIKKFNAEMLWILPMTTTDKVNKYYLPTAHAPGQKLAKVVLSQIRTISSKRLIKKQRTLPDTEFDAVLEKLQELLKKVDPPTSKTD